MTVHTPIAPGPNVPKLRLAALSHQFTSKNAVPVEAISNISLDVAPGSFVSLIGQSGCGKSTLFNILAGLLTPSSGRVLLDDMDITGRAGLVSYMLQKDLLLPWRTVLDNVIYGLKIQGMDRREARDVAEPLMDRYGLGKFKKHYPNSLSVPDQGRRPRKSRLSVRGGVRRLLPGLLRSR